MPKYGGRQGEGGSGNPPRPNGKPAKQDGGVNLPAGGENTKGVGKPTGSNVGGHKGNPY